MISAGTQVRGAYVATIPFQSLRARYGFVPGTLNMFNWSGCDGKTFYGGHTDWINIETSNSDASFGVKTSIGSITTNILSPDGTLTASKINESAAGGEHSLMEQSDSQSAWHPIPYKAMIIAKAAERTRIVFELATQDDACSAGFDLVGGAAAFDTVNSAKVAISATSVEDLGNGWKACKVEWGYTAATGYAVAPGPALRPKVYLDNGSGSAARSISYTGDTSKGVYLWLWHCLPKAAYTAITSRVFHDDFNDLSTVDLQATYAAGYNWYLGNNFTNILWQHVGQVFATTPGDAITLDKPSVMKMYKLTPTGGGEQWTTSLMTICQVGSTPPANINGVRGQWWTLPQLIECSYAFNSSPLPGGENSHANNIAVWNQSVEVFITQGLGPQNQGGAFNLVDGFPNFQGINSFVRSLSEFTEVPPHVDPLIGRNVVMGPNYRFHPNNPASFVRSSGLWLDTAHSGAAGWGMVLCFDNGRQMGDMVYSPSTPAHPLSTDGNVSGWGQYAETQHFPLFLWGTAGNNAALGAPFYVDWISVWK